MEISKPFSQKKVYSSPQLREYGDLREITQTVANNSMKLDGGSGSMQKTS
jgi:hypothetical protein